MNFDFTEDQQSLRDAVQRWVEKGYDFERRQRIVAEGGDASGTWRELADLGLTGLAVPEDDGGMGFGPVEAMVVLEELGRGLVIAPYAQAALMAPVAFAGAPEEVRGDWLPRIAAGEALVVLAAPGARRALPARPRRDHRHRGRRRLDGERRQERRARGRQRRRLRRAGAHRRRRRARHRPLPRRARAGRRVGARLPDAGRLARRRGEARRREGDAARSRRAGPRGAGAHGRRRHRRAAPPRRSARWTGWSPSPSST